MKHRYTSRKYEKRILLYMLLISIIPILILGSFSYVISVRHVTELMDQSNDGELIQAMEHVDGTLDAIWQYYGTVVDSDEVRALLESPDASKEYDKLKSFMDTMESKAGFIHFIDGYSLVDLKNGYVYSNQGIYSIEEIQNHYELEVLSNEEKKNPVFWLNYTQTDWEAGYPRVELGYLSLVYQLPVTAKDKTAMLIINMDKNAIEDLLKGNRSFGSMAVLDADGGMIYTDQPDYAQQLQYEVNRSRDSDQYDHGDLGYCNMNREGERFSVSFVTSKNSEWTYAAYYDTDISEEGAREIIYIALGLSLLMMLLVFAMAVVGTRQIYKPLARTFDNIRAYFLPEDGISENRHVDELRYLESGTEHLYQYNQELAGTIEQQKGQLLELFTLRVLKGQMTKESLEDQKKRFHIVTLPCMVCMLINVPRNKDGVRLTDAEQDLLYLFMVQNIPEEIKHQLVLPPISNQNHMVLVAGTGRRQELEQEISAIFEEMRRYIEVQYGRKIRAGISRMFTDLLDLANAYHEAVEALKVEAQSRETENEEQFTYYSDIAGLQSESVSYNVMLQNQVREAVDKCDETKAFAYADQFVEELGRAKLKFSEQYYFLYRFMIAIMNVASDAGVNMDDVYQGEGKHLFQELWQKYSLEEIGVFYKEQLIHPIIIRLKDFRKNSRTILMEKIEQIVLQRDGDITLTECAEEIGCHVNYIWRVMKELREQTFGEYVAEVRVRKAKELLDDTDLSVADIAERLNFTNPQNFIRYFKKHEGVTPGQYRKEKNREK